MAYGAALRYMLFDAAAAKRKAEKDLADREAAAKAAGLVMQTFLILPFKASPKHLFERESGCFDL